MSFTPCSFVLSVGPLRGVKNRIQMFYGCM
jgi:hypothetical protein